MRGERDLPPCVPACDRRPHDGDSVAVRADDLAAVPRSQRLEDAALDTVGIGRVEVTVSRQYSFRTSRCKLARSHLRMCWRSGRPATS